jgi:TolB protein
MWQDGRNPQRITETTGSIKHLAVSPDGLRLAFASDDAEGANDDIYVMPIWGGEPSRLTFDLASDLGPSWSPDGEWLAFYSGRVGNSEIYTMRADGREQTRLTYEPGFNGAPSWSPDGEWIGFVGNPTNNNDLYRIRISGGIPERITTNLDYDGGLAYSPDGEWLAFTSVRDDLRNFHIYIMRVDGSELTQLTTIPASYGYFDPRWSPDGEWITFWGGDIDEYQIFRMRPDGSDLVALTEPGLFLGPVPSRIIGKEWRGGLMFLLGLLMMLPHVYINWKGLTPVIFSIRI